MEDLVEQYLFQYNHCPLPEIGSLQMITKSSVVSHAENKLSAPSPVIELTVKEIPAEHFVRFIAGQLNISKGEAFLHLEKYCLDLKSLKPAAEIKLDHAGKFFIDKNGVLVFKQLAPPKEFLPIVSVKHAVRKKLPSHNIQVGDTVTTNELMTEFFSEKDKVKKERWWIWAAVFAVIAAASLYFYFKDHLIGENFGNVQPVETSQPEKSYR